MLKYYLGIFGGHGPNPAAAILCNNKLIAFGEEERFVRIKNANSMLPINSILFCLKSAKISVNDLENISIAWDCKKYAQNQPKFLKKLKSKFDWKDNIYNDLHESKLLTSFNPDYLIDNLRFALGKHNQFFDKGKIKFFNHHLCHAASSFFASGFNEALIFTLDGSGEENCSVVWEANGDIIREIETFKLPNTLGGFYGTFTEFLGFKSNSEEGKLMGLAPYGDYENKIQRKLDSFIKYDLETGSYEIDPTYRFYAKRTYNSYFTDKLVEMFGNPRFPKSEITSFHKNLAFNVQWRLEQVVSKLVERHVKKSKIKSICLAGGVAMNCKMNGVLASSDNIKRIYVQPASSDNGTALGAACLAAIEDNHKINKIMPHAYWGPQYSEYEIEKAIKETKLRYCKLDNIINHTTLRLQQGKIVGWFNGRSEIGARSLGARSILANPLYDNMQLKLNSEVKHRENWRPFAPSIIEEEFENYFGHTKPSDYMIIAYKIKKEFLKKFPSTIHVDGSVRPQSVKKNTNPKFHNLLLEFGKLTGHPVLINTSFNVQGEPIVETPQDALRCFSGTGIDVLVLGNFLLEKER